MNHTATVTRKRQFTIPVRVYNELGLRTGDKMLVTHIDGKLLVEPMTRLVNTLAGSIAVPARFKHLKNTDAIIKKAKEEYFNSRI
jgi:AbrB family looped-hinge helix DNA binding protein